MLYNWIKAFHLISVFAWMAGMFYLPRLYVYHAMAKPGSEHSEILKIMERKLLRLIINPAMISSWVFGLWMLFLNTELVHQSFMQVKFACLVAMQLCHALLARARRDFANDSNKHSDKYFRILNEVPTVLLIVIVLMVVVKPF